MLADPPVILWDFDGTLAYRDGIWAGAITSAAQSYGYHDLKTDLIRKELTTGFPWQSPDEHHPFISTDEWWSKLDPTLERAAVAGGASATDSRQIAADTRSRFLDPASWHVYADTHDALQLANECGWENAILSNHVPELRDIIENLKLSHWFTNIITSANTGWEKPNPRAFEAADNILNKPSKLVMIGDSEHADYLGALNFGIPALKIQRKHTADKVLCKAVREITQGPIDERNKNRE